MTRRDAFRALVGLAAGGVVVNRAAAAPIITGPIDFERHRALQHEGWDVRVLLNGEDVTMGINFADDIAGIVRSPAGVEWHGDVRYLVQRRA